MSAVVRAASELVGAIKLGGPEHMRAYAETLREHALQMLDTVEGVDAFTGAHWSAGITAALAELLDSVAEAES